MTDQGNPVSPNGYINMRIGEPVTDLVKHIKFLSVPLSGPNGQYNGFDVEFGFIERRCELEDFRNKTYKAADLPPNRAKNRWTNVLPRT